MRFTLRPRDGSATFQKITTGKKWVGRVGSCEDGRWFGKIGSTFVYADTAAAAFDAVVSRHLGYANADALREHNRQVSARNRANVQRARYAAAEMRRGNFDALFALLK